LVSELLDIGSTMNTPFSPVPQTTLGVVEEDSLVEMTSADNPGLNRGPLVLGRDTGRRAISKRPVTAGESLAVLKNDLERFDIHLAGLADLPTRLREMFGQTERPHVIAKTEDLTKLRSSLTANVAELKNCVARMTRHSDESLSLLNAELMTHRTRLQQIEHIAFTDALTGLASRRKIQLALDRLALQAQPFSLILFDLNHFKPINDQLGHMAGDEILRQFAAELKPALHSTDLVGRWGGDEFIVILDCGMEEAELRRSRIGNSVLGEYTLRSGEDSYEVTVTAAIGMATWRPGETVGEALKRADTAMYRDKQQPKSVTAPSHSNYQHHFAFARVQPKIGAWRSSARAKCSVRGEHR